MLVLVSGAMENVLCIKAVKNEIKCLIKPMHRLSKRGKENALMFACEQRAKSWKELNSWLRVCTKYKQLNSFIKSKHRL